ncbi:MAG: ribosome biogenesis GTP-binding protein YihA/YsxC [Cyclobacteriaceae bacterium]
MKIKEATYVQSVQDFRKCPESRLPEYAFIGRSNVGKSSLINMLTERNKLAKTSARPGKTQTINHFLINNRWHLVDLPGYGWAKVSKSARADWGKMIENYLLHREQLVNLFVLIDSRLPPQSIDPEFIRWAGVNQIPFALVFTKVDKQSVNKTQQSMAAYRKTLLQEWAELPPIFTSSSVEKSGREEILAYIENTLDVFQQ